MKLDGLRQSDNVQDRRFGGRGIAISGVGIVIALVVGLVTGVNPLRLLSGGEGEAPSAPGGTAVDANDPGAVFTKRILATTEDAWNEAMPKLGRNYQEPTLVLFRGEVQSACGFAEAAVGPFYCPGDRQAYLDLDFLGELQQKLGAQGDFAAGYVIAHEIGHHVQKLSGASDRVRGDKDVGATGNSVRLELQADCYAGVWGAYAKKKGLLDVGDVEEAMNAAAAIGDDTLQRRARGRVSPESFSHGTSEQRARWFKVGMESGDPRECDTFGTDRL